MSLLISKLEVSCTSLLLASDYLSWNLAPESAQCSTSVCYFAIKVVIQYRYTVQYMYFLWRSSHAHTHTHACTLSEEKLPLTWQRWVCHAEVKPTVCMFKEGFATLAVLLVTEECMNV